MSPPVGASRTTNRPSNRIRAAFSRDQPLCFRSCSRELPRCLECANFLPALIIDANHSAAEQLPAQLEHAGFAADTVDSCWGAFTAIHAKHYGSMIVVGDLSQPNCLECVAGLRRQAPRSWIIVISSAGSSDTRKLFLTYGVDALIVTPFSMSDLVSRLMAFSRRSRPP